MKLRQHLFALVAFGLALTLRAENELYEEPPVNYSHAKPHDAIARLTSEVATNGWNAGDTDRKVVQSLLRKLDIPVESQMLVFSKTSFQKDSINPWHPRALYYSDDCYVGWMPDGLAEITTIDPQLGPVFYSFDPRVLPVARTSQFSRPGECLNCHGGFFISGIPGLIARSVYADSSGQPLYHQGTELVNYHTPFTERWGGWYVTGMHGKARHRGNVLAGEDNGQLVFDATCGANVTNLSKFINTDAYLTNSSDIVSLLVFEQQMTVQNAITRAGMDCRRIIAYQRQLQKELKETVNDQPVDNSAIRIFDQSADAVADALLFKDEAELPDGIVGADGFQKAFAANARRAKDGSSLKDLLLSDHIFKNRCSYLIYSESFLALPEALKKMVYARLAKALDAEHPDPRYTYIHFSERKRIARILRETHREFNDHQPVANSDNNSERQSSLNLKPIKVQD